MATTATTTATTIALTTPQLRPVHGRRRQSTIHAARPPRISCQLPLPLSLEALDLSSASPIATLASLRIVVLSYLADLEVTFSQVESPLCELSLADTLNKGELKVEEARAWARDGLEMLNQIRMEVLSYLPELHIDSLSLENYVQSRLQELPDVPSLKDVASHFPDMPDVRSHLPSLDTSDIRSRLDDVRARLSDLDLPHPIHYVPTLSQHIQSLQAHFSSFQLPSSVAVQSFAPNQVLPDLVEKLLSSELVRDVINANSVEEAEGRISKAAKEVALAVTRSLHGSKLIQYVDLPGEWRNNSFVTHGYRFIPLNRWPLIILSIFALHNETLNIHTHLIPFVLWARNLIPSQASTIPSNAPTLVFTAFALLCLFTSAMWHTMSGCAHRTGMTLTAKLDYVGIGWLISASVGTVVYYGFQCHSDYCTLYLTTCVIMGIAGTVLPFAEWFNKPEHKIPRTLFFVSLALTAIAPLTHLAFLFSTRAMLSFIGPVVPSLVSYIAGLFFYVSHFPERVTPPHWGPALAWLGGGSHAIWHAFIVLAISQHRAALPLLEAGVVEGACPVKA